MVYMGSKRRIAKYILPIILKDRKPGQWYVEPFVGGGNVIDKVEGPRIGSDSNGYLISMWKSLQDGMVLPDIVTRKMYKYIKNNKDMFDPSVVGFVGVCCSFGGKWFGGYAIDKIKRNYASMGLNSLMRQIGNVSDVRFINSCFSKLDIPDNSIIYCDPPYDGATKYKGSFDHGLFWDWCRQKTFEGHSVFVSEYNAPGDFECVLSVEHCSNVDHNDRARRIEKLFRMEK